ncbi:MAG TPA: hypothetical protein VK054_13935 [Beutenbergiaceae bacterium]|nr:hypothetical protein [Beutenbergiaceae bacterium]
MSNLTASDLILAALSSSPAQGEEESTEDYHVRVSEQLFQIAMLAGDYSPLTKLAKILTKESENDVKIFTGVIHSVKLEKSSTRVVVYLESTNEDGTREHMRTERTDNPLGLAVARKARSLKGRRVLLFVEMEPYTSGRNARKIRVLRQLHDLGEPRDDD